MPKKIVAAPVNPPKELLLEMAAYKEVSADVSFAGRRGHMTARISLGVATGGDLCLTLDATDTGLGEGGTSREQYCQSIYSRDFEMLVALHAVIGGAIERAREIGWHNVVTRHLGPDFKEPDVTEHASA